MFNGYFLLHSSCDFCTNLINMDLHLYQVCALTLIKPIKIFTVFLSYLCLIYTLDWCAYVMSCNVL